MKKTKTKSFVCILVCGLSASACGREAVYNPALPSCEQDPSQDGCQQPSPDAGVDGDAPDGG